MKKCVDGIFKQWWDTYSTEAQIKLEAHVAKADGDVLKAEQIMRGLPDGADWMAQHKEEDTLEEVLSQLKRTLIKDKQLLYDLAAWPEKLKTVHC